MATDYSTIQQHQPLRVPSGWDRQEKAFVVQMEEILDDIYRRFGRLRLEDMSKTFRKQIADDEGNIAELIVDVGQITIDVENKISKTSSYQTADSIVTAAEGYTDGRLTSYSTTTQMNDAIALYVTNNAYQIVSGIAIDANGIDITGSKYVKIRSGGTFDVDSTNFKINSTTGSIETGEWLLDSTGLKYITDEDETTPRFQIAGKDNEDTTFSGIIINSEKTGQIRKSTLKDAVVVKEKVYGGTVYTRSRAGVVKWLEYLSGVSRLYIDTYCSLSNYSAIVGMYSKISVIYADTFEGDVDAGTVTYDTLVQNSSRDIKHNIQHLAPVGEKLDALEPVTFIYDKDPDEKTRTGLIYEDTVEVMPEICTNDEANKAINYVELIPMFLKEIQDLRARVAAIEGGN